MESELLVFFEVQCRRVKFYQLRDVSARYGTPVTLRPEPTNGHDPFCITAFVPGKPLGSQEPALMLGHIAREAVKWICPLLSSRLRVTKYVG